MSTKLLELARILTASANDLSKICDDNGLPFPDLDDPFTPPSEAFRTFPQADEAANIIAAAAAQIVAMVLPPTTGLSALTSGHYKSAALRVCLEANVTEILREGGPQGVHTRDIAKAANIGSDKIGRLLRLLATHHVYKEISPDVFTNNRLSSMLDTGKPHRVILQNPDKKYDDTPGFGALTGHNLDELGKASAYLWETMSDPEVKYSAEINHSAFNRAFKWDGPFWTFFAQPEQQARQHRFDIAMRGVTALEPVDSILKAFDWKSLPANSVVVDVGGGVGTSSLVLAKTFPEMKIIIQDLPPVAEAGEQMWRKDLPEAIASGRVVFQAHDFFKPQPVTNASVFLLKQIMHDWPDAYASQILTRLREVARKDTKLILVESLLPFACHDTSGDEGKGIPGAVPREAPSPLLANYGIAHDMAYLGDLTMMELFNSQERTAKHFQDLLRQTGWRMTQVMRDSASSFLQPFEAVPCDLPAAL